jgi:hypothetical protein
MTVLQVVQDVCAAVGVVVPSSIFSGISTNRTMQEMSRCANEMAQRMAYDTREWTRLKTSTTFVGNGIASQFNLPANYQRMLLAGNVWRSTSALQPMQHVTDVDDWDQRRDLEYVNPWGEWMLRGDQIWIWPAMGVGVTARMNYLDRNCIKLASGGYGDRFVDDADSYRLDERLLKLNMTWQWKAQKGAPYAEDMGTYSDALAVATGADKPAKVLVDKYPVQPGYAHVAYPWPLPT